MACSATVCGIGVRCVTALTVLAVIGRMSSTTAAQPPHDSRPRPPAGAAVRQAEERVLRTFGKQLASVPSRTTRVQLTERLLSTANETQQLADAWVLLQQAQSLAIRAGSYPLAERCIAARSRRFQIDVGRMQTEAFLQIARESASISDRSDLQAAAAALMQRMLQASSPDAALEVCDALEDYAQRVRAAALQTLVNHCRSQLQDAQRLERSTDTLDGRGRYLCFAAAQWEQGLRLLSDSTRTSPLKHIATLEQNSRQSGPERAMQLAEEWWEFGQRQTGLVQEAARRRAARWYRIAAPRLQGLDKARADQVQQLVGKKSLLFSGDWDASNIDLLLRVTPDDLVDDSWRLTDGRLISTARDRTAVRIPWQPGSEYDLTLTVRRRSGNSFLMIGLCHPQSQFTAILNAPEGGRFVSGPSLLDGRGLKGNPLTSQHAALFPIDEPVRISCRVRQQSLTVEVGQQTVIAFRGDMSRLTIGPFWRIRNVSTMFLRSEFSEFEIESLLLNPITGTASEHRP
ncbi:MAG: hypothetical protein NXI04_12880 [Planctomycetaceae bacterium]|nr:hypothetical protein [Planctomycetaceae bacterium]